MSSGLAKLIEAIQEQPSRPSKLRRLNLRGNHLGPSSAEVSDGWAIQVGVLFEFMVP